MCSPGGAQRATDPRAGQVHASQPFYPIAREEREGWGGDRKRERGRRGGGCGGSEVIERSTVVMERHRAREREREGEREGERERESTSTLCSLHNHDYSSAPITARCYLTC